MVRSVTPLCQSHMRMGLSSEAETISSPPGVKARSAMRAAWPPASRSRRKSAPSSARACAPANSIEAASRRHMVGMRLSQPPTARPSEPEQRGRLFLVDIFLDRQGVSGGPCLPLLADIAGEVAPERDGVIAEI